MFPPAHTTGFPITLLLKYADPATHLGPPASATVTTINSSARISAALRAIL
jgi:hypothetical protein